MIRYWFMGVAVARKEVQQTRRDRRMMALLLVAPLLQLALFGYALRFEVQDVPTRVVDLDGSVDSRRVSQQVLADTTLREAGRSYALGEALEALAQGDVEAVLLFLPGFGRDLLRGRTAHLQVIVDGSDPNRANLAAYTVAAHGAQEGGGARPIRSRVLFNPGLVTAHYMVPGVCAMLLLLITTIVSAMGLARERERGTLEQIMVTPVPPLLLMCGKIAPFAVVGLFDFALAMVVGHWGVGVPLRASWLLLVLATLLYLICTLSVGLWISTVSRTQQQAFMGGILFMMPAALLSGIMTPVRSMPPWLEPFTRLNPLRHYAELLRAALLRGASWSDLQPSLLWLAGLGAVMCLFASLRFRAQKG